MPQWKKITRGKHHCRIGGASTKLKMDGKVFEAEEHEIGLSFLNQFERQDTPTVEENPPVNVLKAVHKGRGRWVVINQSTEQQVNDKYLTKEEASALVDKALPEDQGYDICPDCWMPIDECRCGEGE